MKKFLTAVLGLICSSVLAGTSVFNLEIDKTTEKDLATIYQHAKQTGINKYSHGNMYKIAPEQIDFQGLKDVTLIFNPDGVLIAVMSRLEKNFDYVNNALAKKYKLVKQIRPFVGNMSAQYKDGTTNIYLEAPHLSFEMNLNYFNSDFEKLVTKEINQEKQSKEKTEQSLL